jgi:hypothetical protein
MPKQFHVYSPGNTNNWIYVNDWSPNPAPSGSFNLVLVGDYLSCSNAQPVHSSSESNVSSRASITGNFVFGYNGYTWIIRILAVTTNDQNSPAFWRTAGDMIYTYNTTDSSGNTVEPSWMPMHAVGDQSGTNNWYKMPESGPPTLALPPKC